MKKGILTFGCLLLIILPSFLPTVWAQTQKKKILKAIVTRLHKHVCDKPGKNSASCHSHVTTDEKGKPLVNTTPYASSYGPIQFHTAYNLPCTPGGPVQAVCSAPGSFTDKTIAIVDAYHAPTLESDL